jgi:predicted ATPase
MLTTINIDNFKCLSGQSFELGMLNIITGLNSTGKSSVFQAILNFCEAVDQKHVNRPYVLNNFDELRNKYTNAREITIEINETALTIHEGHSQFSHDFPLGTYPVIDNGIYYLSENRTGPEELAQRTQKNIVGDGGCFLFSRFEANKSEAIEKSLVRAESQTLSANVDYWLQHILGVKVELTSQVVTSTTIKINFNYDQLQSLSPLQLGAGVSYLAKILILGLQAKPGEVILIENPEIHLHPGAQSKLGSFFAFIANAGVQVLLETHCEHLINRIRYEVFSGSLPANQVKLFYKPSHQDPFLKIYLNQNGYYVDQDNCKINFPAGFFDSTLAELLEIG